MLTVINCPNCSKAEMLQPPSHQAPPPAPPVRYSDAPRPAARYNLSSVSRVCPGASSQLDMRLPREGPRQMPEPPQLAPFVAEEQRFFFESLWNVQAPNPLSTGDTLQRKLIVAPDASWCYSRFLWWNFIPSS